MMKKGSTVEERIRSTVKAEEAKKGKNCGMKWRKGCVGRQREGKEGASAGESSTQTVLFSRCCDSIDHRSLSLVLTASPLHCFSPPFLSQGTFPKFPQIIYL